MGNSSSHESSSSSASAVEQQIQSNPNTVVVLTIATPRVLEDANYLLQQLPGARIESFPTTKGNHSSHNNDNNNNNDHYYYYCIVTGQQFTIFFLYDPKPSRVICHLNSYDTITSLSSSCSFFCSTTTTMTNVTLQDTVLPELCLPSQSKIIFVSNSFLQSSIQNQHAIAKYLMMDNFNTTNENNSYHHNNKDDDDAIVVHENDNNHDMNKTYSPNHTTTTTSTPMTNDTSTNLLSSLQALWMPGINNNNNNIPLSSSPSSSSFVYPLNSIQPVPFQNELFEGQCLMVIKPMLPQQDPYWHTRLFHNRKRRILWQLQGKFRRPIQGMLYVGAELQQPMQLGLVTQGVARLLLKLVQRFHSNVHYSFGTKNNKNGQQQQEQDEDDDGELAHIVIPAATAMERIVVTSPGEPLPTMGEFWEESAKSISFRSHGQWNTTDTYSMEFFSMYIDLAQWKLVQLPVSGDVALQTFWGESPMTICMYEAPLREKHTKQNKRYAFGVQLKYLGDVDANMDSNNKRNNKKNRIQNNPQELEDEYNNNDDKEENNNDILRWSGSNRPKVLVQSNTFSTHNLCRRESAVFAVEEEDSTEQNDEYYYFFDAEETASDMSETFTTQQEEETGLLVKIDDVCPFWVEVCTSRGGYNKVFVVQTNNQTLWLSSSPCEDMVRSNKWIRKQMDLHFSPRISNSEWTRRALGLLMISSSQVDLLEPLKMNKSVQSSNYHELFLKRTNKPTASGKHRERLEIIVEGLIARAISDRHWIEEWARVYSDRIEFFHPDKSKPHFQISSIIGVKPLSPDECPNTPQFSFLGIETPGRTLYLMFPKESQRDEWELCIQSCSSSNTMSSEMILDNPAEEFLHKSSMWKCKNRRILNCARFSFHSRLVAKEDPLELVTRVLRLALDGKSTRMFLEAAASLKDTTVDDLSEDKKLAFFLNLYHVMISYAFLVLGPPNWSLVWINFFNSVAYQAGDDIFSLTELEHCIIRAKMSVPSQFLSRFAIPKSNFSRMSLNTRDCRVNFALNCGSLSNPESIFIFSEKDIDDQLNAASRLYLKGVTATPRNNDIIIQLPRICQWYRDDFGDSDDDLLRRIREFLPDTVRQATKTTSAQLVVRFLPYQYECRQFVSYQE